MRKRLVLLLRTLYGARNAFAPLIAAIEDYATEKPRIEVVGDDISTEELIKIAKRFSEKNYKPIVLYSVSTYTFLEIREEINKLSQQGISIVAGGPHAAGAYWQVLRAGAEVAVVGDGENAILGLLEYYMGDLDLSSVPNIAFREEGRFRVTRIESVDLDNYRPYSKTINILPPIEIMRGCSYNCSFCQVPFLFKKRVRFRSVESVVDAVKYYVSNGKTLIRFVAPVGLAYQSPDGRRPNPEALEALLRSVRKHGGKPFLGTFPSETRPEQVTRDTLDVLRRYAENTRLAIGMQSGSDRVLALVNREHTVEDVFRAVKLSISYGFTPVVDIIMGLPGEEEEDIRETINAMEKLIAMGAKLRLHTFIPLPGTPLARVKPRGIHPLYRKFIRRMLGRGVLEGDWEYQEKLSFKIYELMASDPYPTPEPRPLDKGTS